MHLLRPPLSAPRLLAAVLCLSALQPSGTPAFSQAPRLVIAADFEKGMPPGTMDYRATTAIDTSRAHSGRASLRLAKNPGQPDGSFSFNLDGLLDFSSGCEFSLWIYAAPDARVAVYLAASDGTDRYNVVNAKGSKESGKWVQWTGAVPAGDWRKWHQDFRLTIRTAGTCWVDDVVLRTGLPESPEQIWPRAVSALHAAAGKRASPLKPGGALTLGATNAALLPDTASVETSLPSSATTLIPAEGLLVFAIDAADDLDLAGTLHLEHNADLRPGLRATVLCNDTVIAAPVVKVAAREGVPWANRNGPAPDVPGEHPPATVELAPFRMAKGRNYIAIAGPHIRTAGVFARLELRAAARPAEKPLHTFALFSDTHLGFTRRVWRNTLLGPRGADALEAALRQLKRENASFAIIAGDLTDDGRRSQFAEFAGVAKRAGLPVHACLGNHDTLLPRSRDDIAATIPKLFPSGPGNTDYVLSRPPLRFIMLDGSHWRGKDTPVQGHKSAQAGANTYRDDIAGWLRDTLASDTTTPTIIVSHYQFYLRRGLSGVIGYDLGPPSEDKKLMPILAAAPNVVATLNGHAHYNAVATLGGITCIQNPAYAEWPHGYRVFRVYSDRLEWEMRQMPNRGLIREGIVPSQALLWALSTSDGDLAGTVRLARDKN